MSEGALSALIPLVAIVGGLALAAFGSYQRFRLRELAYRERLAMIERGLTPPPPAGDEGRPTRAFTRRGSRFRAGGIILIGAGCGLFVLIAFAASDVRAAFGVGGAFVVLGLTFLVLGVMDGQETHSTTAGPPAGPRHPD